MIANVRGRIFNDDGELVGEGVCQIDDERGNVTLRPNFDIPVLEHQDGTLRLELEDGTELALSSRVIKFRVNLPGPRGGPGYRLFFTEQQRLSPWPGQGTSNTGTGTGPEGLDEIPPELRR